MARCISCWYGQNGARGGNCPMGGWINKSFTGGCNLHKPKDAPVAPVEPPKVRGRSLPVQKAKAPSRGKRVAAVATKEPNTTEAEYAKLFLAGKDVIYEGFKFKMLNGHAYTPDWVVFNADGSVSEAHEVKGGYAMFSQGRARLAFDQCKVEFPNVKFFWAKKLDKKKRKKDGKVWIVK